LPILRVHNRRILPAGNWLKVSNTKTSLIKPPVSGRFFCA
jgi:hypothetical protein